MDLTLNQHQSSYYDFLEPQCLHFFWAFAMLGELKTLAFPQLQKFNYSQFLLYLQSIHRLYNMPNCPSTGGILSAHFLIRPAGFSFNGRWKAGKRMIGGKRSVLSLMWTFCNHTVRSALSHLTVGRQMIMVGEGQRNKNNLKMLVNRHRLPCLERQTQIAAQGTSAQIRRKAWPMCVARVSPCV